MNYTSEQAISDLSFANDPWMFACDLPYGYMREVLPFYVLMIPEHERPVLLRGSRSGMRSRNRDRYWIERLWNACLRKLNITVLMDESFLDSLEFVYFRNRFIDKFRNKYPNQRFDYETDTRWFDLVAGKYVHLTNEQRDSVRLLESIKRNLGKKSKRKEK